MMPFFVCFALLTKAQFQGGCAWFGTAKKAPGLAANSNDTMSLPRQKQQHQQLQQLSREFSPLCTPLAALAEHVESIS
jgi:hypothetical protein